MPIYEYKCRQCDNVEEVLQKFDENYYEGGCPECGSQDMRKLISQSDFHLKGSGWYKDGYK